MSRAFPLVPKPVPCPFPAGRSVGPRPRKPFLEVLEDHTLLASYLVNLPGDAGTSSGPASGDIRFAVTQANMAANAGSTITFRHQRHRAGHYAQPRPAGDLAGHDRHGNLLTITGTNGGTASRVFAVTPASPAAVAIDNLTITGGNAAAVASATPGTQGGNVFIQNTSTGCWRTGG